MSPSESSSKVQPRNVKYSQRRTLLSKYSPTMQSFYSVNSENTMFLEDPRRQTDVDSMTTVLTPVSERSVDQRLFSDVSDTLEDTDSVTPPPRSTKNTNYSKRQYRTTALALPINVKGDESRYANGRTSSLSSRSFFKPNYISPESLSSEMFTTSSHDSSASKPAMGITSVPYPSTVKSSEYDNLDPCHLLQDVLCGNSLEATSQVAESDSSSRVDLRATNASELPLSLVSSVSSVMTSLSETQSEKGIEHFASLGFVGISNHFDSERNNSSEINTVSESVFLPKPSVLPDPIAYSETLSFENATLDSVSFSGSLSRNASCSEDETYWTYKHKNSSGSVLQTLTQMKSSSAVSAKTRETCRGSSPLAQRSVFPANLSSNHLQRITVLGLFEMTTRAGERAEGRSELAAARLAVTHINERDLLPGYQLELITNDTKVTSAF